jgi:hypothetical protein
MATVEEIADYIWRRSPQHGVNPATALGIARYEGLNPGTIGSQTFGNKDVRGYSFGPFQLYSGSADPNRIAPGGMAYEFQQKFGQAPSRENWQQQVDFSLETMAKRGLSNWNAVRDRGGPERITELGSQYARSIGLGGNGGMLADNPAQQQQTAPVRQQQAIPVQQETTTAAPAPAAAPKTELEQYRENQFFNNLISSGLSMMAQQQPRPMQMLQPVMNRPRVRREDFLSGLLG